MRALIVGLGGVGQRHMRNLKEIFPQSEIFAVRQSNNNFEIDNNLKIDHSVDIIEKYGVHIIPTLEEALKSRPDIAIVANPSSLHVETTKTLAQAGIPVFVEKPVACHQKDFDELIKLQNDLKTPIMVGYQLRFHPCVQRLKDLLDDNIIGPVQSVEVAVHSYMPSWHDFKDPLEFYAGNKELGGGVVFTEIHEIDLLSWFFGLPKQVMAFGGVLGSLPLKVEDTIGALLEYEIEDRCFPVTLTLSFIQRPPSRRFVVNGREGRIILEIPKLKLSLEDINGKTKEEFSLASDFDRNSLFLAELNHFLSCLDSGQEPLTALPNIAAGQKTALAILDSFHKKVPVLC
jgi:predicted dehydrogenase